MLMVIKSLGTLEAKKYGNCQGSSRIDELTINKLKIIGQDTERKKKVGNNMMHDNPGSYCARKYYLASYSKKLL